MAEHQRGFHLTEQNAGLVAAICRRLDGMPLALELAAAWVRSLALTSILERLDDSFQLLVSGSRSAVPRHRTLQATFDWSYSLLDERERRLLRRLAVFVGTFDLGAVEAVCTCPALPSAQVAHLLPRLVDKSLVAARGHPDGSMRYCLIDVIRQYAQQCLAREEPAERPEMEERHARHYAGLVARLGAAGADAVERAQRIGVEYDDVRLALEWAAREDPALQAMMSHRLIRFWFLRGSVLEARHHLLSAVRADVPLDVRAELYAALAGYSRQVGNLAAALEQIDEASRLLDQVTDPVATCRTLLQRGAIKAERGDLDGADQDFQRALRLTEGLPPTVQLENNLAVLRLLAGHPADALPFLRAAEETFGRLSGLLLNSYAPQVLDTYGRVLLALDRVDEARDRLLAGLELAAENGSDSDALPLLQGLATVSARTGDATSCLELLAAASACAARSGWSLESAVAPGARRRCARPGAGSEASSRTRPGRGVS